MGILSLMYFRYTNVTVDWGMLNVRTISEMECLICLTPTIIPCSDSDNLSHLATSNLNSVPTELPDIKAQLIYMYAFP